jgi:hypothetical protein
MSQSEQQQQQQKIIQYLGEAHATEMALTRVLQSQIAMTPRGSYRTALESHLHQTREHAERVQARLRELGSGGGNPFTAGLGFVGGVVGQIAALSKTPFDLLRGSGGEEKVLKNAKDACASEALEIATTPRWSSSPSGPAMTRPSVWRRRSWPMSGRCSSASCARSRS